MHTYILLPLLLFTSCILCPEPKIRYADILGLWFYDAAPGEYQTCIFTRDSVIVYQDLYSTRNQNAPMYCSLCVYAQFRYAGKVRTYQSLDEDNPKEIVEFCLDMEAYGRRIYDNCILNVYTIDELRGNGDTLIWTFSDNCDQMRYYSETLTRKRTKNLIYQFDYQVYYR